MADLDDVLAPSEAGLRDLMAELRRLRPVDPDMAGDDLRRRQDLLARLRRHIVSRETLVQRYVVPAVKRNLPDGAQFANQLLAHKLQLEGILVRMPWYHERDPILNEVDDQLLNDLEEHLRLEERAVADLHSAMAPTQYAALARRVATGPRWTPTRPHPDTPPSPLLAGILSPLVATLDRLRDRLEAAPSGS